MCSISSHTQTRNFSAMNPGKCGQESMASQKEAISCKLTVVIEKAKQDNDRSMIRVLCVLRLMKIVCQKKILLSRETFRSPWLKNLIQYYILYRMVRPSNG